MKRSEVFNVKYPAPLDRFAYKVLTRRQRFMDEIIEAWKHELVSGMIGSRGYQDFEDMRLEVTKTGTMVARFIPFIGTETQEELNFYRDFFDAYQKINATIMQLLVPYWMSHARETLMDAYIAPVEVEGGIVEKLPYRKRWGKQNDARVHKLIMTLKIMVALAANDKLDPADLYRFTDVLNDPRGEFVESMNALVRDSDFNDALSSEFSEGKAHFYQYPDSELVQSYWKYAKGAQERLHNEMTLKMIGSGFNATAFAEGISGKN
jgi:hypothetical protein